MQPLRLPLAAYDTGAGASGTKTNKQTLNFRIQHTEEALGGSPAEHWVQLDHLGAQEGGNDGDYATELQSG